MSRLESFVMIPPTLYCGGARFAAARLITGSTVPSLNSNPARLALDPRGAPASLRQAPLASTAQSIHHFSSATAGRHPSRQQPGHELAAGRTMGRAAQCMAARTSSIGNAMIHLDVPSLALGRPIRGISRNNSLQCRYFSFRTRCLERDGKGPKEQYVHIHLLCTRPRHIQHSNHSARMNNTKHCKAMVEK